MASPRVDDDRSAFPAPFVIGRSTAFTYKGKAVDLKQIGRELNVRLCSGGQRSSAAAIACA